MGESGLRCKTDETKQPVLYLSRLEKLLRRLPACVCEWGGAGTTGGERESATFLLLRST